MNDNSSRNHFTCYCFVLWLVCNSILAVVSGTTNGRKNDKNTGGRWYDKTKWSNAARNPPPVVEGSGNTDIVSDLDETPRGLGPDDEDSETGSGAMEGPGSVEEGSGLSGIKFETSTGSAFDATHLTTSNVTNKLTNEPGVSTKILPSDSVTVAALFLTTTLAQRPVTQQEPVHSTHKVPVYPTGSKGDADTDEDEEDEDEDDEDDGEDDDDDLYSFGEGVGSSAAPFIPPIVVDADHQQSSFTVTQPSATATIAVKPSIPIEPTLTATTTPSSGVVTISSTSAQPPSTDDDMYDRTPDKRKDRHGFQWIFSAGVLTAVIGGAVVGLLAAILLVMFVVYRMRKKDEGSYVLDEPKAPPTYPYAYHKAPAREFYA